MQLTSKIFITVMLFAAVLGGSYAGAAESVEHKKTSAKYKHHAASSAVISPVVALNMALRTFLPNEDITVTQVNKTIALAGNVSSIDTSSKALNLAKEFVGSGNEILNFLHIKTSQQVMLRVRVGEIQRTALKQIGFNAQGARNIGGWSVPFSLGGGVNNPALPIPAALGSFGSVGAVYTSAGLDLSATLDLLEQNGMLKMLAEPNLVTISGTSAQFLAGGEFPVPIAQHNDTMSVLYKPFGVKIDFAPIVLAPNRIRLAVEPEVSEISLLASQGAVTLKGSVIPAVTSRRAKTTVELAPGESFMIAGLIKDDMRTAISQIPGIGEIPILSALFRSTAFQRNETELVIAVTPYLVDPAVSKDIRLPTDNFHAPSMLDMVFFGALGARSNLDLSPQKPALEGPAGYIAE